MREFRLAREKNSKLKFVEFAYRLIKCYFKVKQTLRGEGKCQFRAHFFKQVSLEAS